MDLCESLKSKNSNIIYLDLSFNSIGTDGGSVLGSALLENKILRELYLTSNNITPEASFILCVGAKESLLEHLCLDSNPIGQLGGQMLMSLAISKRDNLTFTAIGSDLIAKCETHIIDLYGIKIFIFIFILL